MSFTGRKSGARSEPRGARGTVRAARGRGRGRRERRGCRKRSRGVGRGRRGVPRDAPARPARRSRERAAPGDDGDGGGGGGGERGRVGARSAAGPDPWGRDGAVVVSTAEAIVVRRRVSSRGVRGDVSRRRPRKYPGRGASNLAALDDVAQLAATLPGAAAAGLLDERGNGTLHDAVSYLITAVAAVASDAAEASMRARGVGSGGLDPGAAAAATTCSTRISTRFPAWAGPRAAQASRRRPSR